VVPAPPVAPPTQPPPISTNLGKRRQTPVPAPTPAKQVKEEEPIFTISLDDDDDEDEVEPPAADTPMGSIFKKSDGIPGLDLVADGGGKNSASVFDVGLGDSEPAAAPAAPANQSGPPTANKSNESLSNVLKDPNFFNNLTQASKASLHPW